VWLIQSRARKKSSAKTAMPKVCQQTGALYQEKRQALVSGLRCGVETSEIIMGYPAYIPGASEQVKKAAGSLFGNRVASGEIKRPSRCSNCGLKAQMIEGHHWDYTKPLDVIWLCRNCHKEAHGSKNANINRMFRHLKNGKIIYFRTFWQREAARQAAYGRGLRLRSRRNFRRGGYNVWMTEHWHVGMTPSQRREYIKLSNLLKSPSNATSPKADTTSGGCRNLL
jgi:hypothetical protein